MKKILLALCLTAFLFMLGAGLALKELSRPLTISSPLDFQVAQGESIYHVANNLSQRGIIDYPRLWAWYARVFDKADKIKAGEYALQAEQSALQILDDMVNGKVIARQVTLIEGWTAQQAIAAIQASQGIVVTIDSQDAEAILKAIGAKGKYTHIEGLFYPDTYNYHGGTKDIDILRKAYKRLDAGLQEAWQVRAENLPYKNPYEVLIMASIIERETAVAAERAQIAGVFVERLNVGMRLQTDPTVIYGMGDTYRGNIRRKDLLTPTPYNTYTIRGLPPTPIALATQASIHAALHPLLNGKIYFVAKGDGYHYFSSDLKEHQKAVREYQLKRKATYRSAPVIKSPNL